jgi:hypothetical protein
MTTLIATLPHAHVTNGKNLDQDKERIATLTLVGVIDGRPQQLAQARFWMARRSDGASPVYCSLWVYNATAGHGVARGYGYHKCSAALQAALDSAGLRLHNGTSRAYIDGCGDRAMEDALIAVGMAMGHSADTLAVLS